MVSGGMMTPVLSMNAIRVSPELASRHLYEHTDFEDIACHFLVLGSVL